MILTHQNIIFGSVSYRIGNILIDPGDEWEGFHDIGIVLLTHAHFDHIYGLNKVIELNPKAKVFSNRAGGDMLLDARLNLSKYHESPFVFQFPENIEYIAEGSLIKIGNEIVEVYSTPGHNPSCLTFVIGDHVFTGDAYIPGIKTVTNIPQANKEEAEKSVERILNLAKGKTIFPGHA